jgi:hypothetical protein
VNPLPTVTVSTDIAICIFDSTQLTATGGSSYSWSPSIGLSDPNISNPIAGPVTTTTYTVTVTDSNGCVDTSSVTITVNPLPVVAAGNNLNLCNSGGTILDTLGGFSPTIGGTGVWTGLHVDFEGVFTPIDTGVFTLTYTFTDTNTCVNFDTLQVTVADPEIVDAGTDFSVCIDIDSINLFTFQNPSPLGGTWSGAGVTASVLNPSILSAGNYEVYYALGSGTCLVIDTVIVTVNPLPTITLTPDAEICFGDSLQISASGGLQFNWTPSVNISNDSIFNPVVFPVSNSSYTVEVSDVNLCTNADSVFIIVNPLPIVAAGPDLILCNQPIQEILTGYSPGLHLY